MQPMLEVQPAPLALVVDVINGWSDRVRRESGEEGDPYPDLAELAVAHGWSTRMVPDDRLVALADRLEPVFAETSPGARRGALNLAVRALAPTPQQSAQGPVWSGMVPERHLEAGLLFALIEHARDDADLVRLGACEADHCVDTYVDSSRSGTRRFCSLTCQNRARVAAFRQRSRTPQNR